MPDTNPDYCDPCLGLNADGTQGGRRWCQCLAEIFMEAEET